jgi:hypothetical protein
MTMDETPNARGNLAGMRAMSRGLRSTSQWCRTHAEEFWTHYWSGFDPADLTMGDADVIADTLKRYLPIAIAEDCPICFLGIDGRDLRLWLTGFRVPRPRI